MGTDDTAREASSRFDNANRVNEQDREAWNARLSQRRQERRQARLRKVSANNHGNQTADNRSSITSSAAGTSNTPLQQSSSLSGHHHNNPINSSSAISASIANTTPSRNSVASPFPKSTPRHRMHRKGRRRSPAAAWFVRIASCFAVSLVVVWMVGMSYVANATNGRSSNFRSPGLRRPISRSNEVIDMRQRLQEVGVAITRIGTC